LLWPFDRLYATFEASSGSISFNLRIPGDADQRSELMSITIPK
jgi:hypothetical protein